ncbi:hemolysin family protein [Flavobacteriaceae bacterium]|jgi:putative hemolysin|nr:hemolysin [Flavobacteriaceae bacterium]MCP4802712.1 HlyC/CorC family transporter [Bacteroidota bacterium]MDA9551680.1 hemolysin family protein [Flavobacteriaceae bacterium]MDB2471874.1 hemolysin family protein [Flavobacteriaceae bacterium]MDB2612177.1 hemolysin family protein [Flavobacteriaceae bacterium]|tara:strand:- start:671 stop:1960 length:1290 start_codon:yes stop_codon:yes gene_type:complete
MTYQWLTILVSLLFSAFFSGMEIAYVSSNKIHIELEKKQNNFLAKTLSKLTVKPSKFIATMLIGNNVALVIYGFFMGDVLLNWFQTLLPSNYQVINLALTDFTLLTQTIISTLIILVTAEFLPKVFFQIYSNTLLRIFAIPAYLFYVLFSFISDFVIWMSDLVLKYFFKTEGDQIQLAFTKVELGNYISEQMESIEEMDHVDSEIQIFQNALEFSDVKAREVMIPRTELVSVEIHDSMQMLNQLFTSTGYSKILVYKTTVDDILGYVHSFDMFKKPKSIKSMVMPVELVPETMLIKDILNTLTRKRKSIAVVVDEYGGTSGIITVEDIVEELVGEIEDEHDSKALFEEKIDEKTYKLSARIKVDYLNETYKMNLPENETYETLGGLIVNFREGIPEQNEQLKFENFICTILEVSNTKIDLVSLELLDHE